MANDNKNEQNVKNITKLASLMKEEGGFSKLLQNLEGAQKKVSNIIKAEKDRTKKERQDNNKSSQSQQNVTPVSTNPTPSTQQSVKNSEVTKAEQKADTNNTVIIKKADNIKVINKPNDTVNTNQKPKENNKTTKQFINNVLITPKQNKDATPSYIKGVVTPPPPPQFAPRKDFKKNNRYQNNNNNSNNNYQQNGKPNYYNKNQNNQQNGKPHQFNNNSQSRPILKPKADISEIMPIQKDRKVYDKKRDQFKNDDKKTMNKRTLIRKGFIQDDIGEEERMGTRKLKNKKVVKQPVFVPTKIEKATITTENLTVKILSEKIGKPATEIIKQLMLLGIMTNINGVVDFPTMELVANELGVELELKLDKTMEEQMEELHDEADAEEDLVKRPPIITVMGHVDHGKTSLLDAIRKTSVASGEAGGITQHIGSYSVVCKGEKITFLDTPGHEAFTEMRARGAKVTDIAILIVAADDGVMPQTIEAIHHAKVAKVPIIVAINKIDKPGANIDKVKENLSKYELIPEEWGGDTMMVPISAKKGTGIDKLLETILFLAEYNNYRANPNRAAKGSIIESKLDKGKGPIANIIVLNGTLHVGDFVVSGMTYGKVRAMVDDKGRTIKEAGPSTPVSVLGFTDVPNAGDVLAVVPDEKMAKQIIAERTAKVKQEQANQGQKVTLDDVFNKISEGNMKELNLIIKCDVQGSAEALKNSLEKLSNDEVKVVIVHHGVGAINKSDMMLAGVSNAIVIGFNVRPDSEAKNLAEKTGVEIKLYNVIYDAIDDVSQAMKGLQAPKFTETILGKAEVRNVFKVSGAGAIAGCFVLSGKISRNAKIRIYRDNVKIFDGQVDNLKRFKDDVKEVAAGYECGLTIENFTDFKEMDEIEAYIMEETKL